MRRDRGTWFHLLLAAGGLLLFTGALLTILERSLLNAHRFGVKTAASLSDPRVANYVATRLTDTLQKANPDLIAARPLIIGTAQGIVASGPFRTLVEKGAEKTHEALFSEQARTVVLSLPDAEVLLRGALSQASPALAAKIPAGVQTAIGRLERSKRLTLIVEAWRLAIRIAWVAGTLLAIAPLLLLGALWIAPHRRRALFRCGLVLCGVGLLTMAVLPAGSLLAALFIRDPALRGLAQGLWQSFAGEARPWGLFVAGFGVLLCSGATSLLETMNPLDNARRVAVFFVQPPSHSGWRLAWAAGLVAGGLTAVLFPQAVLGALVVVLGGSCAYIGIREFFRLLLARVDHMPRVEEISDESRWALHVGLVTVLVMSLAGAWFWWRSPTVKPPAARQGVCNGLPELCGKRVDEVVFPAAHNAMSNQQIEGWMFPHHEKNMAGQLNDGIRALLFDVHYGLPGAARIKTDLTAGVNREKMIKLLGQEGFDAAMRIRGRLVGVEEGKRGLYLCHGFCELGAYELRPALASIHEFLVQHPDEVLVLIVEDYVTPRDLAEAFESSGLASLVYRGNPRPQWPALGELIASGQRVIVFIESGRAGVPWLRPAFENVRETPYSFHKIEEFTCAPNRGGDAGSLFLMNHWIETTPTPRPSNARIVNAHDFLLGRARQCMEERKHLPNILAVDFYGTGDVVAVARELNRMPRNF